MWDRTDVPRGQEPTPPGNTLPIFWCPGPGIVYALLSSESSDPLMTCVWGDGCCAQVQSVSPRGNRRRALAALREETLRGSMGAAAAPLIPAPPGARVQTFVQPGGRPKKWILIGYLSPLSNGIRWIASQSVRNGQACRKPKAPSLAVGALLLPDASSAASSAHRAAAAAAADRVRDDGEWVCECVPYAREWGGVRFVSVCGAPGFERGGEGWGTEGEGDGEGWRCGHRVRRGHGTMRTRVCRGRGSDFCLG